jgi:two-component system, cell cycle response regulator
MGDFCRSRSLVLVADDDDVMREIVAAWLDESGYDVTTARNGQEALEMAFDRPPDLVLLDIAMPGSDGYAVCRALQRSTSLPPAVIFVTAHDGLAARVTGLDAGAVDYVQKPFDRAELAARVRAALRTKAARDALVEHATRDSLTGLLNRREIERQAEAQVAHAQRHHRPLCVLLIDLDHFKQVNDLHGHGAGDAVLRETAARMGCVCRRSDSVGRYGGEEFLIILPETDARRACTVADKLRLALCATAVETDAAAIAITASIGVAQWEQGTRARDLIARADQALYAAKRRGRNRIELPDAA